MDRIGALSNKNYLSTLYNWPVIGNLEPLLQIENDIKLGNLPNVYLFSGPARVGKSKTALVLAQIFQCENKYCRVCPICKKIAQGTHADTIMLDDNGEKVKIEEVRALVNKINMTTNSKYKVVYIQNIERMTIEASNSFLKTLEEPPANTIFIFTTGNWRNLLPTVVSRSRLVKFRIPPIGDIRDDLKKQFADIDEKTIEQSLIYSLFKPESARDLLNSQDDLMEAQKFYLRIVKLFEKKDIYESFSFVDEHHKEPEIIKQFIAYGIYILRSFLLKQLNENEEEDAKITNFVDQINYLENARRLMKSNVNVKLLLENFFIKLC